MMLIEVIVIKVDVEIVRFGIQYNGLEENPSKSVGGLSSIELERVLIFFVKKAYDFAHGYFDQLEEFIYSGLFVRQIKRYMRKRDSFDRPPGFRDFGEVTNLTSFDELVDLHIKLRHLTI